MDAILVVIGVVVSGIPFALIGRKLDIDHKPLPIRIAAMALMGIFFFFVFKVMVSLVAT